jgi:hypothetical protein
MKPTDAHILIFGTFEAPFYMIQYKLDCTQRIEYWLIKHNNVGVGRHLQNPARHERDVEDVSTVYCMDILECACVRVCVCVRVLEFACVRVRVSECAQ